MVKQNLDKLRSWNGFISTDGTFYKWRKWKDEKVPDDIFIEAFAHDKLAIDSRKCFMIKE